MHRQIYLLLLLVSVWAKYSSQELSISATSSSALSKCLIEVLQTRSSPIRKISLKYSVQFESVASDILRSFTTPAVINTIEHRENDGLDIRVPTELVIVLDNDIDVAHLLNSTIWFQETLFLWAVDKGVNLTTVFHQFWDHYVGNVLGLVSQNESTVSIYSFDLYSNNCGPGEAAIIDYWTDGHFRLGRTFARGEFTVTNMKGCTVAVTVVEDIPFSILVGGERNKSTIEGIEGRIMTEIAKKLNMTALYSAPLDGKKWGVIHPKPAGAVGEVFQGRSEFTFGSLATSLERYENLELSTTYNYRECLTFCVPKGAGPKNPMWIDIIYMEFPPLLWLCCFLSFVLTVLTFSLLSKKSSTTKIIDRKVDLVIFTFSICLGVPVNVPVGAGFTIMFLSWTWLTFVLTDAYKSSMGSKLTVPLKDPDINNFQELLNSELNIFGPYNHRIIIGREDNEEHKRLFLRFEPKEFVLRDAVIEVAKLRKTSLSIHETGFLYYSSVIPEVKGRLHLLKSCYYNYYPRLMARKKSPLMKTTNKVISRLKEAGIVQKWREHFMPVFTAPQDHLVKLSFQHVAGSFVIISIGWVCSTILFIAEMINHKTHGKN